jgi:hypothetical protein
MAAPLKILLLCAGILTAGVAWVWVYYGESQNQLAGAIFLIIVLFGIIYGRYVRKP